jgi:hypothetical protein
MGRMQEVHAIMARFNAAAFLDGLFRHAEPTAGDGHEPVMPCPSAQGPAVIDGPDHLPEFWRDHYEERAAIREHDGGQAREHAEAEALRETIRAMEAG